MDSSLVIWSMTFVMELFSGYIIMQKLNTNIDALFIIMMMLIGSIFLFLTNKEKNKQATYKEVFYKGYEHRVYYLNYVILFVINVAIITNGYSHFSMTSPVLMCMWLFPMISYSTYQNVLICKEKEIKIANKYLLYKDIKAIKVETEKSKCRLYMHGKEKVYYYIANKETIEKIKNIIQQKNKNLR